MGLGVVGQKAGRQSTLADSVSFSGAGVHSGKEATLTIHPADADTGLIFLRTGLPDGQDREIRAQHDCISATALCTVLGDPKGAFVSTVEHVLAALSAYGVDNAILEVDGPEVPIMDGASTAFVEGLEQVGVVSQTKARKVLRVVKPVLVKQGDSFGELRPYDGRRFEMSIAYDCHVIGEQTMAFDLTESVFREEIARARTFGFLKDVERLWAHNFALGSSLENSVVIGDDGVVNPEGTRWADEFVRHKALDAIGDLALAGMPIIGCYRSHKGGHRLNVAMLKALYAAPGSYVIEDAATVRRDSGHAEVGVQLAAAALSPDVS